MYQLSAAEAEGMRAGIQNIMNEGLRIYLSVTPTVHVTIAVDTHCVQATFQNQIAVAKRSLILRTILTAALLQKLQSPRRRASLM
jgi:hypothetical protein